MPSFMIPETLFLGRNRVKQIRLKVPVLFATGNICHAALQDWLKIMWLKGNLQTFYRLIQRTLKKQVNLETYIANNAIYYH